MNLSKTKKGCTFTVYEGMGVKKNWRWRLKHSNGNIIAASTEGFSSKRNAFRNAKATRDGLVGELYCEDHDDRTLTGDSPNDSA